MRSQRHFECENSSLIHSHKTSHNWQCQKHAITKTNSVYANGHEFMFSWLHVMFVSGHFSSEQKKRYKTQNYIHKMFRVKWRRWNVFEIFARHDLTHRKRERNVRKHKRALWHRTFDDCLLDRRPVWRETKVNFWCDSMRRFLHSSIADKW